MSRANNRRASEVASAALNVDAGERAAFAERVCAGDTALLHEVLALIRREPTGPHGHAPQAGADRGWAHATTILGAARDGSASGHSLDGPRTGDQIEQFRIGPLLGEGAFGAVYRATDTLLGREVAIKLLAGSTANPGAVEAFVAGARAASEVRHPGLVQTLHAGIDRGLPFLVLELVRGASLAALLARGGPLSSDGVVVMLGDVGGAVGALHDAGVWHRDIKPANLLVDEQGRVRVTDMGLAVLRPFGEAGSDGVGKLAGTPAYMAPECFEGESSPRSDVYALGITAYEALAGRPPFLGDVDEIARSHREREVPRASLEAAGVPDRLIEIILRATGKRASQRQRSANHIVRDLESLGFDPGDLESARTALSRRVRAALGGLDEDGAAPPRVEALASSGYEAMSRLAEDWSSRRREAGEGERPAPSDAALPTRADDGRPVRLEECPKCWYDLIGLPAGAPCPECGFESPPETIAVSGWRHHRDRGRWGPVLFGRSITTRLIMILGFLVFGPVILSILLLTRTPVGAVAAAGVLPALLGMALASEMWTSARRRAPRAMVFCWGDRLYQVDQKRASTMGLAWYRKVRVRRRGPDFWELSVSDNWLTTQIALTFPSLCGSLRATCCFAGSMRRAARVRSAFRRAHAEARRRWALAAEARAAE